MEARIAASGILTDPQHVAFYTELVKFQANNSLRETQFKSPNKAHRRVLHYLADEMDLEYEYTLATQTVTITKQYLSASVPISQHESFGLFNFSDLGVPGQLHGDVSGISDEVLHSTTLTGHVVPMQCHAEGSNSSYAFQDLGFDSNSQLYSLQNHPFEQTQGGWSQGTTSFQTPTAECDLMFGSTDTSSSSDTVVDANSHTGETPFDLHSTVDPYVRGSSTFSFELSPHYDRTFQDHSLSRPFDNDLYQQGNPDPRSSYNSPNPNTLQAANSDSSRVQSILGQDPDDKTRKKKRKPTTDSPASSGYQETVFNTSMEYASSQTSTCSGKRGPRDEFSKRAMNAVRARKGCWKCKFRRKRCKPETPCDECLKGSSNSPWQAVGCKRGTSLKAEMLPIRLCPQTQSTSDTSDPFDSDEQWGVANRYLKELVDDRERDFETLGRFAAGHVEGDKPWSPEIKTLLEILPRSRYSQLRKPNSLMLLNECILAIVWEIQKIPWSCAIPERGKLDEIVTLLRSAAHLQAVTSTDQLVAKSLICLRSCLEALHIKTADLLLNPLHKACCSPSCKFTCLANLDLSLDNYLDELDRVFFNKENQHNRETWWLSAFYSFCIQSMVRRALIDLLDSHKSCPNYDGATQYLHLAVRLFIASSGAYDPLIKDLVPISVSPPTYRSVITRNERYENAQLAVQRIYWESKGIHSSADYLKHLFEDNGGVLKEPGTERSIPEEPVGSPPTTSGIDDIVNTPIYNSSPKRSYRKSPSTPRLTALPSPGITPATANGPEDLDTCSEFALER